MNSQVIKELIEAFGAMTEMGKMIFDSYINAGFNHADSLKLTMNAQEIILKEAFRSNNHE